MIKQGLLRTVAADVAAGELGKLREGSEQSNGRDVGAGLWPPRGRLRRKEECQRQRRAETRKEP